MHVLDCLEFVVWTKLSVIQRLGVAGFETGADPLPMSTIHRARVRRRGRSDVRSSYSQSRLKDDELSIDLR
jgi:hypothetical protein